MKLLRPFIVPFGVAVASNGKTYQQGQRIPAGTVLTEISDDLESRIKDYLETNHIDGEADGDKEE